MEERDERGVMSSGDNFRHLSLIIHHSSLF